jgi:hypothetical protein
MPPISKGRDRCVTTTAAMDGALVASDNRSPITFLTSGIESCGAANRRLVAIVLKTQVLAVASGVN